MENIKRSDIKIVTELVDHYKTLIDLRENAENEVLKKECTSAIEGISKTIKKYKKELC
jgi:peptide subunit release factor 1 (eRF1)